MLYHHLNIVIMEIPVLQVLKMKIYLNQQTGLEDEHYFRKLFGIFMKTWRIASTGITFWWIKNHNWIIRRNKTSQNIPTRHQSSKYSANRTAVLEGGTIFESGACEELDEQMLQLIYSVERVKFHTSPLLDLSRLSIRCGSPGCSWGD